MRIVIATPFYPPQESVLSTYAAGLEEAFRKQGHEVAVVSFERTLPPGVRHLVYFVRIFGALRGAMFVLALDTWSVGFPAFLAARARGVPFLVRIGGDFLWETHVERMRIPLLLSEFYDKPRPLSFKEQLIFRGTRMMTRGAHALLFTTLFQRRIWEKAYGIVREKAHLVENYFPPRDEANTSRQGRVFVQAGRDRFLKNTSMLHLAFADAKTRHPDIEFDGRPLPRAEHLARLRNAYAVVIPSLSEVCSNTAIEAVSFGVPFVMTNDTGTSERLDGCGLFVDTRSHAALAEAIESLLERDAYERLAARAREFSFTHSWETMAEEILAAATS